MENAVDGKVQGCEREGRGDTVCDRLGERSAKMSSSSSFSSYSSRTCASFTDNDARACMHAIVCHGMTWTQRRRTAGITVGVVVIVVTLGRSSKG